VRPRIPTARSLRCLRSAGLAAILLALSCLNPQPDDFPQSAGAPPATESAPTKGPADVRPAGNADHAPAPQAPAGGGAATPAAPSSNEPANSPGADLDADAGAPVPDAGAPDGGAPAVAQ
jgi:hypothetical protein